MSDIVKAQAQDVAVTAQPSMLQAVMAAALNPELDPERIKAFLTMAREMDQDQKRQEFNAAFAAAYGEISLIKIYKNGQIVYEGKNGKRDSVVTFIKHEDISHVVKPILAEHGLVNTYSSELIAAPPKAVTVMTIMHRNGYSKDWRSIPLPLVDSGGGKNDIQGAGSVSSYGRRYVTVAAFDIVAEGDDDDGNLGKGDQPVTEEQIDRIENILSAVNDKIPGKRAGFMAWVKAQFKAERVSDIRQGAQLEEVMAKLDAAQRQAGLKR